MTALLFGMSTGVLAAQDDLVTVTTWTMDEGLTQGSVEALGQDPSGILWLGTHDGLNWFDGHGFRSFRHDPTDENSLSDDYVLSLHTESSGRIWVGTERGGLNLVEPLDLRVRRFPMQDLGSWRRDGVEGAGHRAGRSVNAIAPLDDSTLVLVTDVGLIAFDSRVGHYRVVPHDGPVPLTLEASEEGVWVGFGDGTLGLVSAGAAAVAERTRARDGVTAIRCNGSDVCLVGLLDGSVLELSPTSAELTHLFDVRGQAANGLAVRDLIEANGGIWVATREGVASSNRRDGVVGWIGQAGDGRGLLDADVLRLMVDADSLLWIGTWNGLARVNPLSAVVQRIYAGDDADTQLPGAGVIAIEPDSSGFWIGTNAGGLRFLRHGPRGRHRITTPIASSLPRSAVIFDLATGTGADLWVAGFVDGIHLLDRRTGDSRSVPIVDYEGRAVRPIVYSVFVDGAGAVWAGTETLGLLSFDVVRQRFEPLEWVGSEFGSRYVWPIAEDASGSLWIGAFNGGLVRLDASRTTAVSYRSGPDGLSDERILTVTVDSRGIVWVGTEGGGLNRLDPSTGKFTYYSTSSGLPHDHVEGIVEDDAGFLWISTNNGLARLDVLGGEVRTFTRATGLPGSRFFANATAKTRDGRLAFGGPAGLTVFDPSDIDVRGPPARVTLTDFSIHGRSQPRSMALAPGGVDLEPDQNFFSFEFAAMDYREVAFRRYRYRLDDVDSGWNEVGARNVANYTSVPPGRHTFRVQARDSQGLWNEAGLVIPVRVRTPYYLTWWFRAGVLAIVLSTIAAAFYYHLWQVKTRHAERLRIAGNLHDDLGGDLTSIAFKSSRLLEASLDEERRGDLLADVGRLARDATHKMREIVWVVQPKHDTVSGLVDHMRDTASVMLSGVAQIHFATRLEKPHRRIDMDLRQDVYLVFKESIQNVVKHAEAKNVHVSVECARSDVTLSVEDDGKGFEPDVERAGSGNGRTLMANRAEKHGGTFTLDAVPGGGTRVRCRMRLT